jgi:transcriptional regulator with XRE-family HTH domain
MMIGKVMANWRYIEKLNVRDAGAVIGISTSTFSRLERGFPIDGETMYRLMAWLFGPNAKAEEPAHEEEVVADSGS